MHVFQSSRHGEHRTVDNHHFPRIFAICISIYPRPQFQLCNLIEIGTTNVYKLINNREPLYEDYRIGGLNPSLDLEYYFENKSTRENRNQFIHGDIEIARTFSRLSVDHFDVRFEMRHLYLVNEFNEIPVILFQTSNTHDLYPQPSVLITPINMPKISNSNTLDFHSNNNTSSIREFLMEHRDDRYIRNLQDSRRDRQEYFHRILNYDNYSRNLEYTGSRSVNRSPPRTRRERHRTISRTYIGAGAGEQIRIPDYYNWPADEEINTTAQRLLDLREERNIHTPQIINRPPTTNNTSVPLRLQSFTIKALIDQAILENMTCPIGMNPLDKNTACVTSCQHIFNRANIEQWLEDHTTCPVCRQETQICNSIA